MADGLFRHGNLEQTIAGDVIRVINHESLVMVPFNVREGSLVRDRGAWSGNSERHQFSCQTRQ